MNLGYRLRRLGRKDKIALLPVSIEEIRTGITLNKMRNKLEKYNSDIFLWINVKSTRRTTDWQTA
jgi:hypothetical protein